jgi:uncharacterized protein (DUF362 family)
MGNPTNRRDFLKRSVAAGAATVAGVFSFPEFLSSGAPPPVADISVVQGGKAFENALAALDGLGGMGAFVKKGGTVAMVTNSVWERPGSFTNPDVALAVVKMCLDAGAKEIVTLEGMPADYWKRTKLSGKFRKELSLIRPSAGKKKVPVTLGRSLKEADVSREMLECDVLINVPIVKHHQGTGFTGNLKNTMGACSGSTCRFFHEGSGAKGGYDDVEFLSQCIADVNLIRKPDLCVLDATEFLTENGPAGPGALKKPGKVVAGRNCVSVDAYAATVLGLSPGDVSMIRLAAAHGIGEPDLKKLRIKES